MENVLLNIVVTPNLEPRIWSTSHIYRYFSTYFINACWFHSFQPTTFNSLWFHSFSLMSFIHSNQIEQNVWRDIFHYIHYFFIYVTWHVCHIMWTAFRFKPCYRLYFKSFSTLIQNSQYDFDMSKWVYTERTQLKYKQSNMILYLWLSE